MERDRLRSDSVGGSRRLRGLRSEGGFQDRTERRKELAAKAVSDASPGLVPGGASTQVAFSRVAPWPAAPEFGHAQPVLDPYPDSEYEEVFERARVQLDHRVRGVLEEQAEATRLYLRLMGSRSAFHRSLLLRDLSPDRILCLVVLIVDEAHRRACEDPEDALEHALLAARIASRLSRRHYGECLVEEMSARVWACVGSACRRVGRLGLACAAFRRARRHLSKGCSEPLEEGLVLEQEAALHATRGRWLEAASALDQAAARFRQVRDPHLESRARIKQGVLEVLRGRGRAATEPLTSGLAGLEGEREPYVAALGQVLLAVLLTGDRALPIQARAREALRQARRWLDWPQARTVRRLVARVERRILRGASRLETGDVDRHAERLVPVWPRRL